MWFPSWSLLFGLPTLFGLSEASTSSGNKQLLPYTSMSYNSKTWEASVDCNAAIGVCRNFDQVKPFFRAFWSALFGFFRIYIIDVNTVNAFRLSSTLTPTKHGTAPRLETSSSVQHPVGFNQHFALTIRLQLSYLYSCFRSHDSSILQPFVPSCPWQVHKVCTIHLICDISIYIYIHIYILYYIYIYCIYIYISISCILNMNCTISLVDS